jgi:hypothetical protein
MTERRELAVTIIVTAVLLLGVGFLTQCNAPSRPPMEAGAMRAGATSSARETHEAQEHEGDEEHEKIQRVGRALQTIGADPEMRKTLGIPR